MTLLQETDALKKTPLYDRHVALGAKIVDFSGWALPVYYTAILAEHQWTRSSASVFDVSHLGEIRVRGKGAFQFLQYRLTNDLRKLEDGKMLYSLLCDEQGRTLDDILIYRESPESYYLIVNAGSIQRDLEALRKYAPDDAPVEDRSDDTACVAVQGPKSEEILEKLFAFGLKGLGYYRFKEACFEGSPVWVSRSGYTGEDGFEIFTENALAPAVWDRLIAGGGPLGLKPAGLGARNTLRLEAGNALYGHEIDPTTNPLEANLGWAVSFEKGGFIGRDMLMTIRERGSSRKLAGFRMLDKAVPRDRYPVYRESHRIGTVTSGSFAPTVGCGIGLAYVERPAAVPGTRIDIEIHGRRVPAEIVKTPFVPLNHKRGQIPT